MCVIREVVALRVEVVAGRCLLCYFGTCRLNRMLEEDAFDAGVKEGRASATSGLFPSTF